MVECFVSNVVKIQRCVQNEYTEDINRRSY